jgi:heme/copper-type cytochrome/quinol oxidase subunit 2
MITPYTSQQPATDFSLRFADLKYSANLAATTDTSLTVPGVAPRYKALIKIANTASDQAVCWIALNETAAAPAGAGFAATTSELVTENVPICREVKAGDVIHAFAPNANTTIGIVLYAYGTNN